MSNSLLLFKKEVTQQMFSEKQNELDLSWDGSFIGEISESGNKIPNMVDLDIFYCISGFYFVLEKFSMFDYDVEMMKIIFDIPRRKFHLCNYEGKHYFMFLLDPDLERPCKFLMNKKNEFQICDFIILAFCWVLDINSKVWMIELENDVQITSCLPHHKGTKITTNMENKLFKEKEMNNIFYSFMTEDDKIDKLNQYLNEKNRDWFLHITNRIDMFEP